MRRHGSSHALTSEPVFVTVAGVATCVYDEGSGSPIVLCHGGEFGTPYDSLGWPQRFVDDLADRHRVLRIDRLGQGQTANPSKLSDYRMSAVVEHFAAAIRACGVERSTLVGHSRGALVAAAVARRNPDLVDRLVVLNSATLAYRYPAEPVPGTPIHRIYHELATGEPSHDFRLSSVTTQHITEEWVQRRTSSSSTAQAAAARAAKEQVIEEFYRDFELLKAETLKWFAGGGFRKPTLLVWGVGDPTVRPEDGLDLFTSLAPHVQLLRAHFVNRCGHEPHEEYPREVAAQVKLFAGTAAT